MIRSNMSVIWASLLMLLAFAPISLVVGAPSPHIGERQNGNKWVAAWTTMPQLVEPYNLPPDPFGGGSTTLEDASLRQTFFMTLPGDRIRFQIGNTFGGVDLPVTAMTVANPTGGTAGVGSVIKSSLTNVTFNGGQASVTVPKGETVWSDPIDFTIKPQQNIATTMYLKDGFRSNKVNGHPSSRTTSWMQRGNQVDAESMAGGTGSDHWYFIHIVETMAPEEYGSVVVLGDSITDGRGSVHNKNNRWPDLLLRRMQNKGDICTLGMNNQAAGGNAVLRGGLGPPLITRYERDLFGIPAAEYVVFFIGVNDLGPSSKDQQTQDTLFDSLTGAFSRIAGEASAKGIKTVGGTITAFGGSQYEDALREKTRVRVNDWILNSGTFDYAVDIAGTLDDPSRPDRLLPAYDSDHLHPNVAGYQALADNWPLEMFDSHKGSC